MKQRIIALLTTGLLILSLAGCAAQNTTAQTLPESVTAGGSGKATAAADIAQLTLGVETEGATTEAAREKNAEAVQAAVDFLTGMGVAESDIKTERIYLGEQYDGGYQMSTRMTVLVREADRAGEAIDGVEMCIRDRVIDVDCPDKVCESMGYVKNEMEAVVCLPNRMSIIIYTPEEYHNLVGD